MQCIVFVQGLNYGLIPIESNALKLMLLLALTAALASASGSLLSLAHGLAHQGKLSLLGLVAEGEETLD